MSQRMRDVPEDTFSPKAFLKARRPEQFSDTEAADHSELDRSCLEYHLATITKRSQEADFQRFAHKICEKTVCPNLVPQTGPTGGGDGKIDAETYPVAESLALAWYVGVAEAHRERWGFAISAKEDWVPKFRKDVANAVATGRGYSKVFFITNQAVPSRVQAKEQDELSAKYGIRVQIFDLTWLLDKVFTERLTHIAIEELKVTALVRDEEVVGPADGMRERRLKEVENRLSELLASEMPGSPAVDLAIDAARLARGLERPKVEVVGRLRRAEDLATRYGTQRQRVEAAYQAAWTFYWWHEDDGACAAQYGIVEALALDSTNVYDLERLTNLWQLLRSAVTREKLEASAANLNARTHALTASLGRMTADADRPSTALQAEALLCFVHMSAALGGEQDLNPHFRVLRNVVIRGRGLIGFPLEPLVDIVRKLGEIVDSSKAYDELFETVVDVTSTADGEVRAARLLVSRGEQHLLQGRPTVAVATLGRALTKLFKHETRSEEVHALYLCACAYADVGLLWAARGTLLTAASVATNDFWQYGDITPYQAACCRRLKWIEVQLGRVPHALAWHELDVIIREQLAARGDATKLIGEGVSFEMAVGQMLLRSEFADLRYLDRLPDALDRLGLRRSADALLFALGHDERLAATASTFEKDALALAVVWRGLPIDAHVVRPPLLGLGRTVTLVSNVLGCRISVACENEPSCLEIAEAVLATLEGFLATGALIHAVAFEPQTSIDVRMSEYADAPISSSSDSRGGTPHVDIRCHPGPLVRTPDGIRTLREATFKVALQVLSVCVVFRDTKRDIESLFRDERAADRAINFASGIAAQENVLGRAARTSIAAWLEPDNTRFSLRRSEPWDTSHPESEAPSRDTGTEPNDGPDPNLALRLSNASHAAMSTISPIRLALWDRASWNGVAFLTAAAGRDLPPTMALLFAVEDAPAEIFRRWHAESSRGELRLRVSIVRGVDRTKPHAYFVVVGADLTEVASGTQFITAISRLCCMEPMTAVNLDRFLAEYERHGKYSLAAAFKSKDAPADEFPSFASELTVPMTSLHVMPAWQVGLNDIERVAIRADREPIIPEGVTDAPVREVLRQNRAQDAATRAPRKTNTRRETNAKKRDRRARTGKK